MNSYWIRKSIEYHGLPLKIVWDGERGEQDLAGLDITDIDYSTYRSRQKSLSLESRTLRIKLHQFIARNADTLFNQNVDSVSSTVCVPKDDLRTAVDKKAVRPPPLESFLPLDTPGLKEKVLQKIQPGVLVYGRLTLLGAPVYFIKPIGIVTRSSAHLVTDFSLKFHTLDPVPRNQKTNLVVTEIEGYDTQNRIICRNTKSIDALPQVLNSLLPENLKTYDEFFREWEDFRNPNSEEILAKELGLDPNEYYSNMANARGRYPPQEYADEIRQKQASKLAFRSVAEGIEHFKEGRHSEAFQCLNKALSIDSRNVEGLVARGALYANSGSFKRAVEDFDSALKLNAGHANARKYMGETLVALGRSYEEDNNLEAAKKAYQDCLLIIGHHEEAQTSLDILKAKMKGPLIEPGELQLPEIFGDGSKKEETSKRNKDKKGKSKKKGKNKKKMSSSSSSESSDEDNGSSDSSSDSSSESSSSSSDSNSTGKRRKKKDKKRVPSPPLLSGSGASAKGAATGGALRNAPPAPTISNDYELKVRNFLSEMNRDEDNYEEKVRRFVEETSKYRKEREKSEKKKRKKKESKKAKKESKKKKKEKGSKKDKKGKGGSGDSALGDEEKLREALKIFENFPILDELGSKLQSLYGKDKREDKNSSADVSATGNSTGSTAAAPEQGKWKMMFGKDTRGPEPSTSKPTVNTAIPAKAPLAKSAFADSDEEHRRSRTTKKSPSPVLVPIPPRPKYARLLSPASMNRPAPIRSGPVVLDKFGNFRLANEPEMDPPLRSNNRGRRSRSRRRSSSSRSRSPGHRRRSRSFSRSRSSRSFSRSRSRSRSRSGDRWSRRGRRGFERQPYFKNRFNNGTPRGGRGARGGGGGGRDWDFRAGGGRGGNRDGFRPRGRGGRFNDRFRSSRSRSYSPLRPAGGGGGGGHSPDHRRRSPEARNKSPRNHSPAERRERERKEPRSSSKPRDTPRKDRSRSRSRSPRRSAASRRSPTPVKEVTRVDPPPAREEAPPAAVPVEATHNDDAEPPPPGCD